MIRLYLEGDREGVYRHCIEMNFIREKHAHKVDPDWLWSYVEPWYRPVLVDEPFLFTAEYCKEAMSQMFGENMRLLNMPPEYVMLNRITFGLNSIMAKLDACENWRQMSLKYYYGEAASAAAPEASARRPSSIAATTSTIPTP